VQAEFILL